MIFFGKGGRPEGVPGYEGGASGRRMLAVGGGGRLVRPGVPRGEAWLGCCFGRLPPSLPSPAPEPLPELTTLILRHNVMELLSGSNRTLLENEVLPAYFPKRRWYAAKQERLQWVRVGLATLLPPSHLHPKSYPTMLVEIITVTASGASR